ncbi:MAG: lysophospholipid acyltransferase family protein [Planctomycetota bacterium]
MWYFFVQFWVRIVFAIYFRMRVFGRENLPGEGGVILASNHQSFLDPPLVGVGLNRQVHYMARKSLFGHSGLFTWLIRSLNAYPVARGRGDIGAVRETMRRLKAGAAILIFPEATRTYHGEMGLFKPGIFMVAARVGVPVVPTVIEGAFDSWPRTRRFPLPAFVSVAFSEPLLPEDYGGDVNKMRDACQEAVEKLRGRLRLIRERTVR